MVIQNDLRNKNEDKNKGFSLWCGKSKNVILGSIIYVASHVFLIKQKSNKQFGYTDSLLSQRCIADSLNITTPSIYNFYKKIAKKHFPRKSYKAKTPKRRY